MSDPDSTAVVVLFDEDAATGLRLELPRAFEIVAFEYPVARNDVLEPQQLGQLYRDVSTVLEPYPDVWLISRPPATPDQRRTSHFPESAASLFRSRVLHDSVDTPGGWVTFSRWVDRPGGVSERATSRRSLAYADSMMAVGIPKRVPITRPFSASELAIDPDTLALYLDRLPDTTFSLVDGCSEVELVLWIAAEKLGQMGPGVVPVLVQRIDDPDPFVRERVQEALLLVTQDERIMARTGGEYLKFYDQPADSSVGIVRAWWATFGHFWAVAGSPSPPKR